MMEFLLTNWKLIAIAILAALCALLFKLWQGEVRDFAEFKGAIVVLGQEAEKHAKMVEDQQKVALKEARDEWEKALPGLRSAAIDNYMRRFPNGLCGNARGSEMPSTPSNPKGGTGTVEERVVAESGDKDSTPRTGSQGQDDFVNACAEDALLRRVIRHWAIKNQLKAE